MTAQESHLVGEKPDVKVTEMGPVSRVIFSDVVRAVDLLIVIVASVAAFGIYNVGLLDESPGRWATRLSVTSILASVVFVGVANYSKLYDFNALRNVWSQ